TEPQLVTIFDRPVADFAVSDSGICVPATISLTDTSTSAGVPIVSYTYDVSGGGQFNIPNPSIAFNTAGAYTIQQIIEDVNGCRDTATQNIDIYPSITANFSAVDTSGCVNAPITFIDQSGGASAPVSWNWFVDDSLFSSVQFPALAFDSVGSFDIGLIVGNSFGCEDSLTKPNFITLSGPEVAFLPDSAVGCRGTSINFSDITNADTTIVSWQWDFGDGNTATGPNPTHTYFQSGNYTVSLTITDANGCQQTLSRPNMVQIYQPPTAAFSMDQNSGCAPLAVQFTDASSGNGLNIISYAWDFDNGNTYNFPNGNQTFTQSGTYDIQLVVEDARGCLDTTTQVVTVNAGPQANFTADIFSGCSPRPIQFLSQAGGGTQVVNWNWDFGDGNTGSGALVSHTYQTDGIYDITLAVADANGCTDTLTVPQYINIGDPDLAFTVSENQTCPGAVLTFTDSSQVDTPLVNWIWDFGDG
ncbi:MAG: PKD domain-containing protein, partial [Bacteroidota bacterium]